MNFCVSYNRFFTLLEILKKTFNYFQIVTLIVSTFFFLTFFFFSQKEIIN